MYLKTSKPLLFLLIVPVTPDTAAPYNTVSYIIGGVVALLILGYLIYTLFHPEKF